MTPQVSTSPVPLRVALGLAATAMLVLAGYGAVQSVRINWQFGLTLAPPVQAPIIAGLLAAIEVMRICMPFAAKGLDLAGLGNRYARAAFWIFTAISVLSAAGYFKMNRDAAGDQRATQISFTAGYKSELRDITTRLQREITRSAAEVDAELKAVGRTEVKRRAELEAEKAVIEQRPQDIRRLAELQALDVWKTVVTGKDVQAAMIVDMLPVEDREAAQRWVAGSLILLVILGIELAVGRTPFAAVMILAWALRRPDRAAPPLATGEPAAVKVPPADHVQRFLAGCITRSDNHATQWKQLYGGYTKFCAAKGWQALNEFPLRRELQAALGGLPISDLTEKRKAGIFWKTLVLKPQWLPEEVARAA